MKITVVVKANSKRESVEKQVDDSYLVRANASPIEGKANLRVIELLAKELKKPKSKIQLISGQRSKIKIFEILLLTYFLLLSTQTFAHSGRTDANGCHTNRKTGEYHCHRGGKVKLPARSENVHAKYERSLFHHWIDEDRDCFDTRAEILKEQSLIPVKEVKRGGHCTIVQGKWDDFYYAETLTNAKDVDIDHVVPLEHAFYSGAKDWSNKRREQFANDPENLVVTNKHYNRQKGAKTILEWMPVDRSYACKYSKRWIEVKQKYDLLISEKEKEYIAMLSCP